MLFRSTLVLPTGNGTDRQAMIGNGSGTLSFAWDAGSLFYRLNADLAGANVNTAQSVFGVGVTLPSATVYGFQAVYGLTKTAGVTSHTLAIGFGGTATINNVAYEALQATDASSTFAALTYATSAINFLATATSSVVSAASTSAARCWLIKLTGTVSINAGGTFLPQYTLSTAPGGAYSTIAGSYIRLTPIGAAGSNSSQGTWS